MKMTESSPKGQKTLGKGEMKPMQWDKSFFPKQQILGPSKLKEFVDDNFKLMKMAESSPKGQKTLEKGEIAPYETFPRLVL